MTRRDFDRFAAENANGLLRTAGQAYTSLIAQAADDVSAAVLTLEDGTELTATVDNGWAVAWWPPP